MAAPTGGKVQAMRYDVVVVGGGPAGLAAATWLGRYRRRTLVVDGGDQRNRLSQRSHGYLGSDPDEPLRLLARAQRDLRSYPQVELRHGRATAASAEDGGFVVMVGGEELRCRRLILATGVVDVVPQVDGFIEHYGVDVFHCVTCDGYEARDRAVVAFGWDAHVASFALELLDWAESVTVVTDGRHLAGDGTGRSALTRHGVEVVEEEAAALLGRRGRLEGVRLRGGRVLPCSLAFFSIENTPRGQLADQVGCRRTEEGCIEVDADGQTSVPGVYAAGDITPGMQLVQVAAGKGAVVGTACAMSLYGEPAVAGAPEPAPDPAEAQPRG
jgi:thioredoxin reductase